MAYLIRAGFPAADEVRRVLRAQNGHALMLLDAWHDDPVAHIHRTRRTCKKIRALLRLLRRDFPYVWSVENAFYRDLQRSLAWARDAEASVEALGALRAEVHEPRVLESLDMLRESLAARARREAGEHCGLLASRIGEARTALETAGRRLARLPLDGLRRRDLRRGARRELRLCARRYAQAATTEPTGDALHALRKAVKYAAFQQRLLGAADDVDRAAVLARLDALATHLGHGQDRVVLGAVLRAQPDSLCVDTHLQRLRRLVDAAHARSVAEALALGATLFADATSHDRNGPVTAASSREDSIAPSG